MCTTFPQMLTFSWQFDDFCGGGLSLLDLWSHLKLNSLNECLNYSSLDTILNMCIYMCVILKFWMGHLYCNSMLLSNDYRSVDQQDLKITGYI